MRLIIISNYCCINNELIQIIICVLYKELFLAELEYSLRTNRTTPPIVKALVTNLHSIKLYLLSTNINVAQPAARLLSCIG